MCRSLLDHVVAERFLDVVDKDLLGSGGIGFFAEQRFGGPRDTFRDRTETGSLLLALVIYPDLYSIYLSFTNEALTGAEALRPRFVGFRNGG
ncbi:hypothetical protein ACC699_37700, partial [Rhizobium ruizarguesonis]